MEREDGAGHHRVILNHAMNHARFVIGPELNVVQDEVQGETN